MRFRAGWGRLAVGLAVFTTVSGACREEEPEVELAPPLVELPADELGRLGARLLEEPARVRELLSEAGLTPAEFRVRVEAIRADSLAAEAYARGFQSLLRPAGGS